MKKTRKPNNRIILLGPTGPYRPRFWALAIINYSWIQWWLIFQSEQNRSHFGKQSTWHWRSCVACRHPLLLPSKFSGAFGIKWFGLDYVTDVPILVTIKKEIDEYKTKNENESEEIHINKIIQVTSKSWIT